MGVPASEPQVLDATLQLFDRFFGFLGGQSGEPQIAARVPVDRGGEHVVGFLGQSGGHPGFQLFECRRGV